MSVGLPSSEIFAIIPRESRPFQGIGLDFDTGHVRIEIEPGQEQLGERHPHPAREAAGRERQCQYGTRRDAAGFGRHKPPLALQGGEQVHFGQRFRSSPKFASPELILSVSLSGAFILSATSSPSRV